GALDQPEPVGDPRDLGVEDEAGVGGVVVGDEDDGALGLGGAQLAEDVVGGALGKDPAQAPLTGREVVGDSGRSQPAESGTEQPPAAQRRQGAERAESGPAA